LIETITYRFTAHSSDDDDRAYRDHTELDNLKDNDPLQFFGTYLREVGLLNDQVEREIQDKVKNIVNDATDYAEAAAYSKPEDALKYVYKE